MKFATSLFCCLLCANCVVLAQSGNSSDLDWNELIEEATSSDAYTRIDPRVVSEKKGYVTETVKVKEFNYNKWKEIVGNENYSWEDRPDPKKSEKQKTKQRDQQTESLSPADRVTSNKRFEGSSYDEPDEPATAPSTPITSPILTTVVYAVAIGIISYILFLIVKNASLKQKDKKGTQTNLQDDSTPVENIKELEVDRLLREALTSGNYRLAIRICFLGLLKKLDEDGLIVWKKDKTNRDYLSELYSKSRYFNEVKTVTLAYEQVWYGDHDLHQHSYENIISAFKNIDDKLREIKPGDKK